MEKSCGTLSVAALIALLVMCGCQGLVNGTTTTATAPPPSTLQSINHIVVMAQENRSFDTYFGQLPAYWAAHGYPAQAFNGMPANASNPAYQGPGTVAAVHLATECMENLSPSWNESHVDWNRSDPTASPATMDVYVNNAAKFANDESAGGKNPPFTDLTGVRAMGYYDDSDLNYYYFMASNFATSDNWFSPAMDRTQVNRLYFYAATSQGYAYPPGTTASDSVTLTAATIFDELDNAGISWKIYATDDTCTSAAAGSVSSATVKSKSDSSAPPSSSTGFCTYLTQFQKYASPNPLPPNVVTGSQFLSDAQAGTLPAVSFIEPGYLSNRDEHPSPSTNTQTGAAYVEGLINGLMSSQSWKDSVFILTYDEAGGTYDHVAPAAMPNPDGIAPIDLAPTDICGSAHPGTDANCDFNYTGFRVPLIVVSPFTRKNYVSHTASDYTAVLKFIETRFGLQPLTERDKAQTDMTEFFDFQNVPWATPPNQIPQQSTSGACNAAVLGNP